LLRKDDFVLLEEKSLSKRYPYDTSITDSVTHRWSGQPFRHQKLKTNEWGSTEENVYINNFKDTIIMDRPGLIFYGTREETSIFNSDTTINSFNNKSIYLHGLGLYQFSNKIEGTHYWGELVEQITLDDFLKQGEEPVHRVAYIDTSQAFDKDIPLSLCMVNNRMYDYYNGSQVERYRGGKKNIWDITKRQLKEEKLFNESGYLTFRFIVNCKGQAGKYITEEADLDFQRKEFNSETATHFYKILRSMEDWIPTNINGEDVDAYFYLTFKLKDGKLIEILP